MREEDARRLPSASQVDAILVLVRNDEHRWNRIVRVAASKLYGEAFSVEKLG